MARISVLGANSFSGAVFVDAALTAGHDVSGINRSPEGAAMFLPYKSNPRAWAYRFHKLHLVNDLDAMLGVINEFRPDYVVDFAGQGMVAESWHQPELWYMTNLVFKVKLHDHLRKQPWLQKYVRVSTPEVYGSTDELIREDHPYRPSTPYAVSHAAVDMSLTAFQRNYGFPVVLTRFANFYGPGQQLYRIVPKTILVALTGKKLQLHGGGTSIRAFIHARDVASALLLVLEKGVAGETYHFSTAEFLSIRQVVERILIQLGIDFDKTVEVAADRPGKDQAYLMDASKAARELGWKPRFGFDEGVAQTVSWIKGNLDAMRTLPWDYAHKS